MRPATSAGEERERVENVTFRSPGTNEKEKVSKRTSTDRNSDHILVNFVEGK